MPATTYGQEDLLVELMDPCLDIGRPELRSLRDRYTTAAPVKSPVALGSTALIVAAGTDRTEAIAAVLHERGWETTTCAGPSGSRCPLMLGRHCSKRENADAAIVFLGSGARAGELPKLRCAADKASPHVLVLEGRVDGAAAHSGGIAIGSLRGPAAIAEAVVKVSASA